MKALLGLFKDLFLNLTIIILTMKTPYTAF